MDQHVYSAVVQTTPLDEAREDAVNGKYIARSGIDIALDCGHHWTLNPTFSPPAVGERVRCRQCEDASH